MVSQSQLSFVISFSTLACHLSNAGWRFSSHFSLSLTNEPKNEDIRNLSKCDSNFAAFELTGTKRNNFFYFIRSLHHEDGEGGEWGRGWLMQNYLFTN